MMRAISKKYRTMRINDIDFWWGLIKEYATDNKMHEILHFSVSVAVFDNLAKDEIITYHAILHFSASVGVCNN